MAIPTPIDVSGDVVAAATTLGGLVLVFLGYTVAGYDSYDRVMRTVALRNRYRRRGWFVFAGFVLAILAALLALFGKWLHSECASFAGLIVFAVSSVWVIVAAAMLVQDIQ